MTERRRADKKASNDIDSLAVSSVPQSLTGEGRPVTGKEERKRRPDCTHSGPVLFEIELQCARTGSKRQNSKIGSGNLVAGDDDFIRVDTDG